LERIGIFALPPSELAVHPSSGNEHHEICLMCDDIKAFVQEMSKQKIVCSEIQNQTWGPIGSIDIAGWRQTWRLSTKTCRSKASGKTTR